LYYRAATQILTTNTIPDTQTLAVWKTAMNSPSSLPTDKSSLAKIFAQQGDGVLLRLRAHITTASGNSDYFHLAEQIDKNTGVQSSAENLTWSYAEVFNAMNRRAEYLKAAGM
jgi:hypothetical protein